MSDTVRNLRQMIGRRRNSLRGNIAAMAAELAVFWRGGPERQEAMRVATDIAGRMAGAGASQDLPAVSKAAEVLEEELRPLIGRPDPLPDAEQRRIMALFGELERIVLGLAPDQSEISGEPGEGPGNAPIDEGTGPDAH